jgi:hypothetical protein
MSHSAVWRHLVPHSSSVSKVRSISCNKRELTFPLLSTKGPRNSSRKHAMGNVVLVLVTDVVVVDDTDVAVVVMTVVVEVDVTDVVVVFDTVVVDVPVTVEVVVDVPVELLVVVTEVAVRVVTVVLVVVLVVTVVVTEVVVVVVHAKPHMIGHCVVASALTAQSDDLYCVPQAVGSRTPPSHF